jgi:hypothetical protein
MRNLSIPLVLSLSLLACEQETVSPTVEGGSYLARTGVDVNKNQVIRYQDHFAQSWSDAGGTLRATHTTFPIPGFDGKPERDCGPQQDLAKIDYQQVGVVNPIDFFLSEFHINASGPVWVIVRDLAQPGDCYGVKLIAEGPGQIRYLDNDQFGLNEDETHANTWGFLASGTLTTPDERTVSYEGESRYVVTSRNGEQVFMPEVERVSLH